ncbi:MAG: hypothetical protein LRY63_09060 [Nitrincola sp.]|nr:hypothetical protein [Nitrincola sp.]
MGFNGTVLLVSHDRAFLDNVVTSTLVFEGQGRVREYVGGYQDWLRQRGEVVSQSAGQSFAEPERTQPVEKEADKIIETTVSAKSVSTASRKLSYKLQRELDALPAELEAAEAKLEALQQLCAAPDFYNQDHALVAEKLEALQQQEAEVERLMERWVELEALQES